MRIVVLICSCHQHRERRDAVRETWLKQLPPDMPHFFYVGRGDTPLEPDVIHLDVGDTYEDLPPKSHAVYNYLLKMHQFDWSIKVDDDSFLAPERLPGLIEMGSKVSEYIGSDAEYKNMYATGGAGIVLSRRLAEVVASQPMPLSNPANPDGEDGWIGLVVRQAKNKLWWTPRLQHSEGLHPQKDNDVVTGHWIKPDDMRKFYAALYG